MKVLVINGSPKGEKSDCMRLTRAFLRGMGEQADIVWAHALNVKPCKGCFGCWSNGGKCVIEDDMADMLKRIVSSDTVIWSFPLYCYGMPAPLKAIVDRMLPLSTSAQEVDEDGRTYHPNREQNSTRFVMISGSGFPNIEHNFEGLIFQFDMLFGEDSPKITCMQSPLLNIPEAAPVALPYLERVEQAGREYKLYGAISEDTQAKLKLPMIDPDEYRRLSSGQ